MVEINKKIRKELFKIVGKEGFYDSIEDKICYSYDATSNKFLPDLVLRPINVTQVSSILKICNLEKIPIVPRGAGSGYSGGSLPIKKGIVLDLTRMNKILDIDNQNLTVTVEPGIINAKLRKVVESQGLFYPPDPASMEFCTIGGNIAENSGGPQAFKYGVTKNYVLSLEVVLANGDILKIGAQTIKSVVGYNIKDLIIGSEGTLGVVTKAMLRLIPLPESRVTLMVSFDTVSKAAHTVSEIVSNKLIPATIEFMDSLCIKSVEKHLNIGLPIEAAALLLIELDGEKEEIEKELLKVKNICEKIGVIELKTASLSEEREKLWRARRATSSSINTLAPNKINEDIAVPRSKIPEFMEKIKEISNKYELLIPCFGHAGDGNIHVSIMLDKSNPNEYKRYKGALMEIFKTTINLGGTLSGEHGIGISKSPYLKMELSDKEIGLMKSIKKLFDPNNILNPNKIFPESDSLKNEN